MDSDDYGSYRGRRLPPPGRENIVVRTPNPLPAPKSLGSKMRTPPSTRCDDRTEPEPVRSDAHATQELDDGPFIAYALVQAFKLFTALVCKRWPRLK